MDMKLSPNTDMRVYPNGEMKISSIEDMKDSPKTVTKDYANGDTKDSTKAARERNEIFTHFKYFNHLSVNTVKNYLNHITNNRLLNNTSSSNGNAPPSRAEPELTWVMSRDEVWDTGTILRHSGFSDKNLLQIQKTVSGPTLVSYILYVFGPEKDSFNAPWQFIRSRLLGENPDTPIPGKVSYLSKLPPIDLAHLIQDTQANWAETLEITDFSLPGADVWKQYIRSLDSIHTVYEIAEILGLAEWR